MNKYIYEKQPAFYMRISREDRHTDREKDESESIENQRKILEAYHLSRTDLGGNPSLKYSHETYDLPHLEYVDDGFSGASFERPAFTKLIDDCRKGMVSAVLVKDLSRLGRDYIQVGDYLEHVFPFLNVRFISVCDKFDTGPECSKEMSFDIAVYNLVNEYYRKDIAVKAAAGRAARWKAGELTSVRTPLGYVCHDLSGGWKIDPGGKKIVRKIFDEAICGRDTQTIADKLNKDKVPAPYMYLKKKGLMTVAVKPVTPEEKMVWNADMVRRILRDESYTGCLIQGKDRSAYVGSRKRRTTPDMERFRHEDDHAGIVTQEEFDKAQYVIRRTRKTEIRKNRDILMKELVRCGNCRRLMVYTEAGGGAYYCRGRQQKKYTNCPDQNFSEASIKEIVFSDITVKAEVFGKQAEVLKREIRNMDPAEYESRIGEYKDMQIEAYEQYVAGMLSQEEFLLYREDIRTRIEKTEAEIADMMSEKNKKEERLSALDLLRAAADNIRQGRCADSGQIKKLIKAVYIYGGGRIRIEYNYDFESGLWAAAK